MMSNHDRQTKIIVTSKNDDKSCKCEYCQKILVAIISGNMVPSFEENYKKGNIPIPNWGWFCNQDCAEKYEMEHEIQFARTKERKIDYYSTDIS